MRSTKILLVVSALILFCFSCNQEKGKVSIIKNGAEVYTGKMYVKVQFYKDNVIRVVKWTKDGTSDKKSLSVIQNDCQEINIQSQDNESTVILNSETLSVKIDKVTGSVEYLTSSGESILKETGEALLKPVVYDGDSGFTMQQDFSLEPTEGIYGLGQHQDGYFNYRGKEVKLAQVILKP